MSSRCGLTLVDTGVVYINPDPGYRYQFACHSHHAQIGPQELICAFQRGQALYSVDSVLVLTRSRDGGRTWTTQGLIHDPAGDDRAWSYHGPMLTRLGDGSLLLIAIRWDRSDPAHPLFNEVTGGTVPAQTILMRSSDKGATWSAPRVLALPAGLIITPSSPIVVLADGRWFLTMDQWHGYEQPGPYKPRTVGLFSADGGGTWTDPITFGVAETPGVGHWHGRMQRLRDDRLFTLLWSAEMESGGAMPLHHTTGSPDGREWSTPAPTNVPGQTNWPVELGDGRVALIYTVRETDPPGFYAALSADGGVNFDLDGRVHVWDATGRDKIGISAPDAYPRSHDTISYGAPTALLLDDGDVFATFWCTEVAVTHIRYARLRV